MKELSSPIRVVRLKYENCKFSLDSRYYNTFLSLIYKYFDLSILYKLGYGG